MLLIKPENDSTNQDEPNDIDDDDIMIILGQYTIQE